MSERYYPTLCAIGCSYENGLFIIVAKTSTHTETTRVNGSVVGQEQRMVLVHFHLGTRHRVRRRLRLVQINLCDTDGFSTKDIDQLRYFLRSWLERRQEGMRCHGQRWSMPLLDCGQDLRSCSRPW